MSASNRTSTVEALRRARPTDRFLRGSVAGFGLLLVAAFALGDFAWSDWTSERRLTNLARFVQELRPFPLQGRDWDGGVALDWAGGLLRDRGGRAALQTLAISLVAIALAGIAGFAASLPAARTFARPDAWSRGSPRPRPLARAAWLAAFAAVRGMLIALRSLPEYVWAFLLLALLGPTPWAAVLALALHNTGILGRLGAETVENAEPRVFEALRGLGAGRAQIVGTALYPQLMPRFLLFHFYRWETCVREATVLGMLGIASLGFWVEDARSRGQTDVLVFMVLLGSAIVLVGDAVSALARAWVRRA